MSFTTPQNPLSPGCLVSMCRTCSLSLDNNFGSCCCKTLHLKLFPDTRNAKKFSFGVLILVRSLTLTEVVETRVDLATVQRSYYKSFWSLLLYLSLELCPSGQREEKGTDTFCLLYTSPSPRDQRGSRMPSSA